MQGFKKILFPVDLSDVSPIIATYVNEVADKFGAEVHVLFVARLFQHYRGINVPLASIELLEKEIVKGAREKMNDLTEDSFKDREIKVKLVSGDPGEEIVRYAQDAGMDLIIIGTHGRKGIERVLFGSVAEHVVKESPVPVLTINPYKIREA